MSQFEKALQYCESVTKKHAKIFYFAARFLPRQKQKAVFPIYALCRHVDDEIDESAAENQEKAIKAVEKWRAELENVYAGETNNGQLTTDNGQFMVLSAWQEVLKTSKIPLNLPLELIEGVLMDTHTNRYETFEELYVYCYRVASTVGLMSSEILGYSDPKALEYAEKMGIGMQLTNILRDVKEDAGRGRIYLPQEDLRRFNVSEEQVFDGRADENFIRMMRFQVARARDFYREGERGIGLLEKDSRFTVLLASRIYGKILNEIERQNYDVFRRRAHTTKGQKLFSIPRIWFQSRRF